MYIFSYLNKALYIFSYTPIDANYSSLRIKRCFTRLYCIEMISFCMNVNFVKLVARKRRKEEERREKT